MPDLSAYEVVEDDDDGTYAVVWAATGSVVEMDGQAQRGLTIDRADDMADHIEALDRIAEGWKARLGADVGPRPADLPDGVG